jgi:hypothetical protein
MSRTHRRRAGGHGLGAQQEGAAKGWQAPFQQSAKVVKRECRPSAHTPGPPMADTVAVQKRRTAVTAWQSYQFQLTDASLCLAVDTGPTPSVTGCGVAGRVSRRHRRWRALMECAGTATAAVGAAVTLEYRCLRRSGGGGSVCQPPRGLTTAQTVFQTVLSISSTPAISAH